MKTAFEIRAVQLDLARHYEKIDYIEHYFQEVATRQFNTVVLYLEGRIRTESFPDYPEESYSPEEMKKLVECAAKLQLEIIPVVGTLGHAEMFFAVESMRDLAEERDGRGRFSSSFFTFCPGKEETYQFLARYLGEIAAIFPGKNFHVGLDETWNIGYCDVCRELVKNSSQAELFMNHVRRIYDICTQLGKRMWMWGDMFEFYPEKLDQLPRDVVITHWDYSEYSDNDGSCCRLVNGNRTDWLRIYTEKNFDFVVCPWGKMRRNIEMLTDYARRYQPKGMLLTQWEGTPRLLPDNLLLLDFTGKLWSSYCFDTDQLWRNCIKECFPDAGDSIREAINLVALRWGERGESAFENYLRGPLTTAEFLHCQLLQTADRLFAGTTGYEMFQGFTLLALLRYQLRQLGNAICAYRAVGNDVADFHAQLAVLRERYRRAMTLLKGFFSFENSRDRSFWHQLERQNKHLERMEAEILHHADPSRHVLKLHLFLKDFYAIPFLKFTIGNAEKTVTLAKKCYKPVDCYDNGGFYHWSVPFDFDGPIDFLDIEYTGYGGQGITYCTIESDRQSLTPVRVDVQSGLVTCADSLLKNDQYTTMLGQSDTLQTFLSPEQSTHPTILRITLESCIAIL